MSIKLAEILAMQGVVIRNIPKETRSRFGYRERRKLRQGESIVESNGRKYIESIKVNSLGGKFIVTFKTSQDSQVCFNIKRDGVGDSIESAYADYRAKQLGVR